MKLEDSVGLDRCPTEPARANPAKSKWSWIGDKGQLDWDVQFRDSVLWSILVAFNYTS
jgi:hypothetical protein